MAKTANQALYEASLRHHVHLLRFSEGQAQAVAASLLDAENELLQKITAAMAKGLDATRLEGLLKSIKLSRAQVYEQLGKDTAEALQGLAEAEADWETTALKGASPVQLNLASVPLEAVHATVAAPIAGIKLEGWLDNIRDKEALALQQAVTQAVLQGETIDDLVRRIRGTKAKAFQDGILAMSTRNAQALARTAVNHVSNQARETVWEANSDIVRALRWTSTLDGRTSTICQSRDGHMTPIGESALLPGDQPLVPAGARPPAHFNCRSVMVPVMDGVELANDRPFVADERVRKDREKAFRAEAKERGVPVQQVRKEWAEKHVGTVPAATTYQDWLKGQPHAFQDEVLGKGKAELFRSGVPLERFVDKSGKVLTLAELKAEIAGDALNVLQPAIGLKAKGLLMQGLEPDEVLAAIKNEFPNAATTKASIASYKSELNKAGLLGQAPTPKGSQKYINHNTTGMLNVFESKLPDGLQNAVSGQWAHVVDSLDGHPGAYAHYKPGVGVQLADDKLGGLSKAQVEQVMAHELGHLLHKQHGLEIENANWQKGVMEHFNLLPPEYKKLYGYYATPDELWAEIVGQAIHPSPVTSQGMAAGKFVEHFDFMIEAAQKKVMAKFPDAPPVPQTGPVVSGIGEIAGKPTSIGAYAKSLLLQGMPDEQVLAATLAEFPSAKTTMNSIKSYKSELKKAEKAAIGTPGPTVTAQMHPKVDPEAPLDAPAPPGVADPAAELPKPQAGSIPLSGMTKVGGKPGGTNPGAVYQDALGNDWLVKGNIQKASGNQPADISDARARNEVLAARLLREADPGIAPEMKLVDLEGQYGGGLGVASRMLEKPLIKFDVSNPAHVAIAQKDFALHAWLGNWDVVGESFDNLVMKQGKAVNIDPGGALLFRAQGLPKSSFSAGAEDFITMRQASKNKQTAKVYGSMSPDALKDSAKALFKFTDEVIDKHVDAMGPGMPIGSGTNNEALKKLLKMRRDAILKEVGLEMPQAELPTLTQFAEELAAKQVDVEPTLFSLPAHVKSHLDEMIDTQAKVSTDVSFFTDGYIAKQVNKQAAFEADELITAEEVAEYKAWKAKQAGEFGDGAGGLENMLEDLSPVEQFLYKSFTDHPNEGYTWHADQLNQAIPNAGFSGPMAQATWKNLNKMGLFKLPGLEAANLADDTAKAILGSVGAENMTAATLKASINAVLGPAGHPLIEQSDAVALLGKYAKQAVKAISVADFKAMTPMQLAEKVIPVDLEIKSWYGKTKASFVIQKAATELFKTGVDTQKVHDALVAKFGTTFVPKTTSLASMKSKLKKLGLLTGAPTAAGEVLKTPKLWAKMLGSKSSGVKEQAKLLIPSKSAKEVIDWIGTQFSKPDPQGAQDLYELAYYEVKTGKTYVKPGVAAWQPKPTLPAPVPLRPATHVNEAGPPPPRFTKEGRQAGLQKYGGLGHADASLMTKINKRQLAAGLEELEEEELSAIKAYTNSAYHAVNQQLRSGMFAADVYLQAWTDAAMHGLHKLPAWTGTVKRGMNVSASQVSQLKMFYRPGAVVEEKQFTSTANAETGGSFGGNVRYTIHSKTGRDVKPISSHKGENEILFMPGTKFKVIKIEDTYNGLSIELQEV